jgi:hypothetical protein
MWIDDALETAMGCWKSDTFIKEGQQSMKHSFNFTFQSPKLKNQMI